MTIDQERLLFGRSLHGVIEGDGDLQAFVPGLVEMQLPLAKLVTTFPFADIDAALAAARGGTAVKPVLVF